MSLDPTPIFDALAAEDDAGLLLPTVPEPSKRWPCSEVALVVAIAVILAGVVLLSLLTPGTHQ